MYPSRGCTLVGASVFLFLILLPIVDCNAQASIATDTFIVDVHQAIRRSLDVSPEVDAVAAERSFAAARKNLALASRFATEFNFQSAHAIAPGLEIPDPSIPRSELYLDPNVRNNWEDWRPLNRFETSLIQPIYTWGELGGNIRAARHGIDVEDASVRATEIEVALRTGELYYGLLLAEALERLTVEAGEIVDRADREIRRLLEEGAEDVDDADLFKVQITEQEFHRRVAEVEQRLETVRSALKLQMFLPDEVYVDPIDQVLTPIPLTLDSLGRYRDIALERRPELAQASAGVAARGALVDVARSGYYPKLFMAVESRITLTEGRFRQPNPYVSDPYRGRSLRAGFGVRLPLNFAQTRARVQQAEAQRNQVHYQLTAARQLVRFEVEEAYRNVITERAAMEAQDRSLSIARDWLRTEQINFDLDLGDTENLVDAVQAALELEAAYYESVRRYNASVLRLFAATGTLVDLVDSGTLVEQ